MPTIVGARRMAGVRPSWSLGVQVDPVRELVWSGGWGKEDAVAGVVMEQVLEHPPRD